METSYCFKVTGFQFLEKVKKKNPGFWPGARDMTQNSIEV